MPLWSLWYLKFNVTNFIYLCRIKALIFFAASLNHYFLRGWNWHTKRKFDPQLMSSSTGCRSFLTARHWSTGLLLLGCFLPHSASSTGRPFSHFHPPLWLLAPTHTERGDPGGKAPMIHALVDVHHDLRLRGSNVIIWMQLFSVLYMSRNHTDS